MPIESDSGQDDINFIAPETGGQDLSNPEAESRESLSPQELGSKFIEEKNQEYKPWAELVRGVQMMIVGVMIEKFGQLPYFGPSIENPTTKLLLGGGIMLVGILAAAKAGRILWQQRKNQNTEADSQQIS